MELRFRQHGLERFFKLGPAGARRRPHLTGSYWSRWLVRRLYAADIADRLQSPRQHGKPDKPVPLRFEVEIQAEGSERACDSQWQATRDCCERSRDRCEGDELSRMALRACTPDCGLEQFTRWRVLELVV